MPPPLAIPLPMVWAPLRAVGFLATPPIILPIAPATIDPTLPMIAPLAADRAAVKNILPREKTKRAVPILIISGLNFTKMALPISIKALARGGTNALRESISVWPKLLIPSAPPAFNSGGFLIFSVMFLMRVVKPLRATDKRPVKIPPRAFKIFFPPSIT